MFSKLFLRFPTRALHLPSRCRLVSYSSPQRRHIGSSFIFTRVKCWFSVFYIGQHQKHGSCDIRKFIIVPLHYLFEFRVSFGRLGGYCSKCCRPVGGGFICNLLLFLILSADLMFQSGPKLIRTKYSDFLQILYNVEFSSVTDETRWGSYIRAPDHGGCAWSQWGYFSRNINCKGWSDQ